ncbi:3-hydroxyacyl-CoA dehydrogenase [Streptomyces sulfonofaciens]|uniref:3-hydroxyacyl-CoA dehydrogenase n=1 Tax=Streptomyces sulfonofaciens TaxID=68272 RepID=A0A919FR23_9ACTN|nr:3-hydroxyacyl-CoA dehydrogenase [Streptomyces sulfonofaciens]GHH70441.1 3-hydroxyacyl-CoA dehydrogenase [Streptomyces sulfonofaciens]
MTAIDRKSAVAVVGSGTMGQGIAQVALLAGHPVRLHDAVPGRAEEAGEAIAARLERLVGKGRLSTTDRDAALARLETADSLAALAGAALVVEAVVERLDAKQALFRELEEVVDDACLLATNTSSLSVTAVGGALRVPGRLVGLHFFNPAPLLPLVEVVSGVATDEASATRAYDTARSWGKTPVRCADTPGFIVNRIARPYYAEAFRLYEERAADPATIDAVLRESGGFRMGPFELTDLIGQDVNEAVTRSVWESFFHDPKFTPSPAQRRLVESGRLGRKSGHGWYDYAQDAEPARPHTAEPCQAPAEVGVLAGPESPLRAVVGLLEESGVRLTGERSPAVAQSALTLPGGTRLTVTEGDTATGDAAGPAIRLDLALNYRTCTRVALAPGAGAGPGDVRAAIGLFQKLGKKVSVVADAPGMIVGRTVAMLVDFALDAQARGVADRTDIDTAMKLGVNYPRGPLEWCDELGVRWVRQTLQNLHAAYPGGRYGASLALAHRSHLADKQGLS